MKKYFVFLTMLVLLASCGGNSQKTEETTNTTADKMSAMGSGTNLSTNTGKTMTENNGTVQKGNKVSVLYTGSLVDGTVFDASSKHGNQPLEFTVGAGQMIPGFDAGVVGMKVGETKKIEIEPKDAYGEYDKTKVQKVEKSKLKDFEDHGIKLEKGSKLPTQFGNLNIIDSDETTVTLDLNPELAGKKLIFEVTIQSIQ